VEYTKRTSCAGCGNTELITLLDLGSVPFVGEFPSRVDLDNQTRWSLQLVFCNKCKLVQTDSLINPKVAFKDYKYLSSVSLSEYFKEVANVLDKKYNVKGKDILEIGCNDGVLLEPLCELGANAVGVDPSESVEVAKQRGLKVHRGFFSYDSHVTFKNKFDLVLSNNAFAHIIDIHDVVKGVNHVLKPNGEFIFEVHYLKSLIVENQWDNIYHEHIYYYSLTALNNIFKQYDMTIIDYEIIPIHSGSIRVTVSNSKQETPQKVLDKIDLESVTICDLSYLTQYSIDVKQHILDFNKMFYNLDQNVVGYGASGRAGIFCSMTELDVHDIEFIVDESPQRAGRYLSGTKIPIVDFEHLQMTNDIMDNIDVIFIFAWNYSKMIIEKTKHLNCKYLVAFPTVQLVDSYEELKGFESI
tara:strand:+ start:4693 stop:5931 length:1239 start_codon:yes stop_codon:yes gene_type:complete